MLKPGFLAIEVTSHGTYVDQNNVRQESKRSASNCLQVAVYSTDIVYSFRLFFPSEEEANNMYNA
ncbi:hypothetical protein PHMEG_00016503 [Phytophthora megakarya]|uniref:Uncharacterized protein n=1 Tax=Phytophthora megakarya TaxID=4795 RepID=A0A225VYU9_9STRA|nr:hypothetical protein PHMEG_00016503 [Phytophthora megakarya]